MIVRLNRQDGAAAPLVCPPVQDDPSALPRKVKVNNAFMRCAGRMANWMNCLGRPSDGGLGILTYHRVAPCYSGFPPPWHNVEPDTFRAQLSGLLRRGYRFLPLQEAVGLHLDGSDFPDQSVVVTFDDGFAAVYRWAFPILRELQIPATIFINTGYLDSVNAFPFDAWGLAYENDLPEDSYRPLTTAECREMSNSGLIELAAHTHTHADYRGNPDAFRCDLLVCLDELHERFQITNPTFAFPYGTPRLGYSSEELMDVVRELDMQCALTTGPDRVRSGESPFGWGRFNVFPWDSDATLDGKLCGRYSWAPRAKQKLLG